MYDNHRLKHPELYRADNSGENSSVQKQKASHPGPINRPSPNLDRTKNKKVDGQLHPRFSVTIVVQMPDNRRRDLDGMLATILDCICSARRQLAIRA